MQEKGYDEIVLYGALSGRIDHTFANIRLLMYRYPHLVLLDDRQKITLLSKGEHVIKKHIHMYLSLRLKIQSSP